MNPILFSRVAIIGLGLLGSSVARAVRSHFLCEFVNGYDQNPEAIAYCEQQGIITNPATSVSECVKDADLIILCTPTSTYGHILGEVFSSIKSGAVITDVGSVKELTLETIMPILPAGVVYIPSHPIAGSEKSGPQAGTETLFHGRRVILTPDDSLLEHPALGRIQLLWEQLGSKVEFMPAFLHDQIYGYISHLPQLMAFAAYHCLATLERVPVPTAEWFQGFIRLSKSPALLWTDIFLSNQRYVVAAADDTMAFCQQIYQELREGDEQAEGGASAPDAATNLFPRIASSCLIASVSKLEKQLGMSVARFAGKGFADMAAPAIESPETDIERISGHYKSLLPILEQFMQKLGHLRQMIAMGLASDLLIELEKIRALELKTVTSH